MTQRYQIIIAALPVVAALVLLSPPAVVLTFLLFGDAHIFTAFLYQQRAGKIGAKYWRRFLVSVVGVGMFLFVTNASLPLFTLLTATVFVIHFLLDEIYLLQTRVEPLLFFAMAPVFLLYVVPLSDKLLGTSLGGYALIASVGCAVVYLGGTLWRKSLSHGGFWMMVAGLILAGIMFFDVPSEKLLATVILFHYARWLVFYADKYWTTPRFVPYVRNVILVQVIVVLLFLWYSSFAGVGHLLLSVLFTEVGLYTLTLLHIFTTSRGSDYQRLLRAFLPGVPALPKQ